MKILPSIVRVPKISCSQPKTDFSDAELEEAARLILEMQGVVMPVILRRTAPESESYTVIDGAFEYYAAMRSMEIDSRKGKKINAYIVESEEEEAWYQKQIVMFRQRKTQQVPVFPLPEEVPPVVKPSVDEGGDERQNEGRDETDRLTALEQSIKTLLVKNDVLEKTINTFALERNKVGHETLSEIKAVLREESQSLSHHIGQSLIDNMKGLSEQVAALQEASQKPISPVLPTLSPSTGVSPSSVSTREAPVIKENVPVSKPPSSSQQTIIIALNPKEQRFLEELNTLTLEELGLKFGKLTKVKRKADVISFLVEERNIQPFSSTDEMKKRAKGKGLLGDKTIKHIVEQWA